MKKFFLFFLISAIIFVNIIYPQKSIASVDKVLIDGAANFLVKLKIMRGYVDGSLRLENSIKRSEFITLMINSLGYSINPKDLDIEINFSDINGNHWAYYYVKSSVKNNLIVGYPDNSIKPNNTITYAEVIAVLIRSLGYEKNLVGQWPENVVNMANELGITNNIVLPPNKELTRGEVSLLIFNSLKIDLPNYEY